MVWVKTEIYLKSIKGLAKTFRKYKGFGKEQKYIEKTMFGQVKAKIHLESIKGLG